MSENNAGIGALHEVRANFATPDALQGAVDRLLMAGFDRADLSVPEAHPPVNRSTPESGAMEADTGEDAQQARTVHTSTAAAMAGIAAAGLTVATGGAALPAIAAAVGAAGVVGGVTFAASTAANQSEQSEREARAAAGELLLSVHAASPEKQSRAEEILRLSGGTAISAV